MGLDSHFTSKLNIMFLTALSVYGIGFAVCLIYQRLANDYYIRKYSDANILRVKLTDKSNMFLNSSLWMIYLPVNLVLILMGQDKNHVLGNAMRLQELNEEKAEKSERLIKNMSTLSDDDIIDLSNDIEKLDIRIEKIKVT